MFLLLTLTILSQKMDISSRQNTADLTFIFFTQLQSQDSTKNSSSNYQHHRKAYWNNKSLSTIPLTPKIFHHTISHSSTSDKFTKDLLDLRIQRCTYMKIIRLQLHHQQTTTHYLRKVAQAVFLLARFVSDE